MKIETNTSSLQPFGPHLDLNDKTILVTGGTGSFGRSFIKVVLKRYKIRRCIVFSRDELKQYEMSQEFPAGPGLPIRYFIGDVRDVERLELAMRDVDYVVHAAALKHVQTAEYNPFECVKTNIHGAQNVVNAALNNNVDKVIALSTDKAVNPTNFMGASKRIAEIICLTMSKQQKDTCFSIVRFGNVLGSSGSVVPLFKKQIEKGGPITLTHLDVTRFFMTIPEAVQLVIQAGSMAKGGEIFVLDMGKSIKILDLAKRMIYLSGKKPILSFVFFILCIRSLKSHFLFFGIRDKIFGLKIYKPVFTRYLLDGFSIIL